jgi:hypothetical protein
MVLIQLVCQYSSSIARFFVLAKSPIPGSIHRAILSIRLSTIEGIAIDNNWTIETRQVPWSINPSQPTSVAMVKMPSSLQHQGTWPISMTASTNETISIDNEATSRNSSNCSNSNHANKVSGDDGIECIQFVLTQHYSGTLCWYYHLNTHTWYCDLYSAKANYGTVPIIHSYHIGNGNSNDNDKGSVYTTAIHWGISHRRLGTISYFNTITRKSPLMTLSSSSTSTSSSSSAYSSLESKKEFKQLNVPSSWSLLNRHRDQAIAFGDTLFFFGISTILNDKKDDSHGGSTTRRHRAPYGCHYNTMTLKWSDIYPLPVPSSLDQYGDGKTHPTQFWWSSYLLPFNDHHHDGSSSGGGGGGIRSLDPSTYKILHIYHPSIRSLYAYGLPCLYHIYDPITLTLTPLNRFSLPCRLVHWRESDSSDDETTEADDIGNILMTLVGDVCVTIGSYKEIGRTPGETPFRSVWARPLIVSSSSPSSSSSSSNGTESDEWIQLPLVPEGYRIESILGAFYY